MPKRLSAVFLVAIFWPGAAITLSPAAPLANFPTEQAAQTHCRQDTVVWLTLPTGIYHFRGQRWYGATRSGAYVCQTEADKAGMRATRSGQ